MCKPAEVCLSFREPETTSVRYAGNVDMKSVENIAMRARELFDSRQIDTARLASLYQRYNSLEDVTKFVAKGMQNFPHLCCGLASVYLREEIGFGQIIYGTYHSHRHSFLLIDGRLVVDITADQFGGPKVYVGALKLPWSLEAAALDNSPL